ncbi:hypothetical protein SAMN03080617_00014 [Algoriphagus alkaliphilus]|uniref:Uncharacterized protein n=1 Tax=Algoriphagus alkaliphilus TaxID=279824 RepID=A0A1G5UU72_9BACT|nr:hypothetical protein SAMN03080617_00014 [Algoriphagus alkaliphilus]
MDKLTNELLQIDLKAIFKAALKATFHFCVYYLLNFRKPGNQLSFGKFVRH